jgi:hypothetical protein
MAVRRAGAGKGGRMRQVTGVIILAGAAALSGCASRAPAPLAATGAAQEIAPVTAQASANAGSVPPTSPVQPVGAPSAAPATSTQAGTTSASTLASASTEEEKFVAPDGYQQVIAHGKKMDLFCRTEDVTGSRLEKYKVCRSRDELKREQEIARRTIEKSTRDNAASAASALGPYGEGTLMSGPGNYNPYPSGAKGGLPTYSH